jgi:hypothetical protein
LRGRRSRHNQPLILLVALERQTEAGGHEEVESSSGALAV